MIDTNQSGPATTCARKPMRLRGLERSGTLELCSRTASMTRDRRAGDDGAERGAFGGETPSNKAASG